MEITVELVFNIFLFYQKQLYSDYFTERKVSVKENNAIIKLLSWRKWEYEELITFIHDQYLHYITKGFKRKIVLGWIIGKKSFDRFSHKENLNLNMNLVLVRYGNEKIFKSTFEDRDKSRFHNSEFGFIYCQTTTTLFSPKSNFCITCKFQEECKECLKEKLPSLFNLRLNESIN